MRTSRFIKYLGLIALPVYIVCRIILNHYRFRFGIDIPYNTEIGPGLYIGHFGGIVVNWQARIGKNCNLNHDVTIGVTYGGKSPGVPIIGDNVYLGPGSKIIGGITIGKHCAIGANSVVTKDMPDGAAVVGIPGEIASMKGSTNYVVNTV